MSCHGVLLIEPAPVSIGSGAGMRGPSGRAQLAEPAAQPAPARRNGHADDGDQNGADDKPDPDEILEGVTGMTLQYHAQGSPDYVDTPADWKHVDAVLIGLNLASRDKVGTDRQTLKRDYEHVVAIRSRAP